MDPKYLFDSILYKKSEDPNKLRGDFYAKINSCGNIFSFKSFENTAYQVECEGESPYRFFVGDVEYMDEDIPYEPPSYFSNGITKMYALTQNNDPKLFAILLIVNFDIESNEFSYVQASIKNNRWCSFGCRSNYYWDFDNEKSVDFTKMYIDYPIILKDFIDEENIGVKKIISFNKK